MQGLIWPNAVSEWQKLTNMLWCPALFLFKVASLATEELRRKTNEPDEDGWITVRKTGGKYHQTNNNNDNTNRYFTVG